MKLIIWEEGRLRLVIIFVLIFFFMPQSLLAEESIVRVCSQNLFRLGQKEPLKSPKFKKQLSYLLNRVKAVDCSVIALQEVVDSKSTLSQQVTQALASALRDETGEEYEIILSSSNDNYLRNGFLIRKSQFYVERYENWNHNSLPKLDLRAAPRSFSRGPLAIRIKFRDPDIKTEFYLVNDHLKSKSGGWKDPSGTQYEILRVLSAAEIRRKLREVKGNHLIEIFLGDRNTGESGAAAQLLQGRVTLESFYADGGCSISSEGSALCPPDKYLKPDMIPLLEEASKSARVPFKTYKRGKKEEILDEIYIFEDDRKFVLDKLGGVVAGTEGEYYKGSDHLLAWAEFKIKE